MNTTERYVLMLDTDPDDRDLTESILKEIGNTVPVHFINRLADLQTHVGSMGDPAVILVSDRGAMHKGSAILRQLKTDPRYLHIPIIVLGEVSTRQYVRECYAAGANTFITKPSTVVETKDKIGTFFKYWFEVAEN